MFPIKYSTSVANKFPQIYDYTQTNLFLSTISYIIDSNQRKSVELSKWLKEMVCDSINHPTAKLKQLAKDIPYSSNYDTQAFNVFRFVKSNLNYMGDLAHFKKSENWNSAWATVEDMTGDCEDGAILIYVLCRMKGIPANRLLLWAGNVQASPTAPMGGHACCFYKPINYPLAFVNLDWCYFPDNKIIENRNLYLFDGKDIHCFDYNEIDTTYKSSWFLFNEDVGYSYFKRKAMITYEGK